MAFYNYGSINIDHVYRVPYLVRPGETLSSYDYQQLLGGKGANQSIALARAGGQVIHLGRYHPNDQALLEPLVSAGVDPSGLQAVNVPSGHAIIQVDQQGENSIILYGGANHSFQPMEIPSLLQQATRNDWLLLQNECTCTGQMIQAAVDKGLRIAFNPAPMNAAVAGFPLEHVDLLIVNEVELMQLVGADEIQADQLNEVGLEMLLQQLKSNLPNTAIVVTLGARGARYYYQDEQVEVRAPQVDAVDTTAAGDTFIGYLLQATERDLSVRSCLQWACYAAALCVQQAGASSSIPPVRAVRAFVERYS